MLTAIRRFVLIYLYIRGTKPRMELTVTYFAGTDDP